MLLADPGTPRPTVLAVLQQAPDVRADPNLASRYRLTTPLGNGYLHVGSKDPVESIHVSFPAGDPAAMVETARRILDLAERLEMQVEDVLWGREVTRDTLPLLRKRWEEPQPAPPSLPGRNGRWWRRLLGAR